MLSFISYVLQMHAYIISDIYIHIILDYFTALINP